MSDFFLFTIPGQPMSWNRSYRSRVIKVRDGSGAPVLTSAGRAVTRPINYKTREAEAYQELVGMLARLAKPRDWAASEIIVAYDFRLARDIDCDNVMKMIHDALARAIDLDDRYFYPAVLSKTTGSKDPSVQVAVYNRAVWRLEVHA